MAKQYKESYETFKKTAVDWTKTYADLQKSRNDKISKITEMGFTSEQAFQILKKVGWDEQAALQHLLQ